MKWGEKGRAMRWEEKGKRECGKAQMCDKEGERDGRKQFSHRNSSFCRVTLGRELGVWGYMEEKGEKENWRIQGREKAGSYVHKCSR